jgi:hypothetical protein
MAVVADVAVKSKENGVQVEVLVAAAFMYV